MSDQANIYPDCRETYIEVEDGAGTKLYRTPVVVVFKNEGPDRSEDEARRHGRGYGTDRYYYLNGVRFQYGSTRTLVPDEANREINGRFRLRTAIAARTLRRPSMQNWASKYSLDRRNHAYVRSTIELKYDAVETPTLALSSRLERRVQRAVDAAAKHGQSMIMAEFDIADGVYVEARLRVVQANELMQLNDRIEDDELLATRQRIERRKAKAS